jgi:chromosome segregation ATPase
VKKVSDITVKILQDIRDDVRALKGEASGTNHRLDATNQRLDNLKEEVDVLREDLGHRIVESEMRTATAITKLAGDVQEMTAVLRASAELRPRVERCERDIAELQRQNRQGS